MALSGRRIILLLSWENKSFFIVNIPGSCKCQTECIHRGFLIHSPTHTDMNGKIATMQESGCLTQGREYQTGSSLTDGQPALKLPS